MGGVHGGSKRCLLIPQICSDRRSALVHFVEDNVVVELNHPTNLVVALLEEHVKELNIHIMKNSRLFILYGASKGLYFE